MVSDALSLFRALPVVPLDRRKNPLSITVKRAVAFTVDEDGHSLSLRSTQPSLALALKENGISLRPGRPRRAGAELPLTAGLIAEVRHASKVTVVLPEGEQRRLHARDDRGDALVEAGIAVTP